MNVIGDVDYVPYPEDAIALSSSREKIKQSTINWYRGSASENDTKVYAEQGVTMIRSATVIRGE